MFLFPYRAQIKLHKVPTVTIAVAVLCLVIYFIQFQNEERVEAHAESVCAQLSASTEGGAKAQSHRWGRWRLSCEQAVLHIYFDPDPIKHLAWHTENMAQAGDAGGAERIRRASGSTMLAQNPAFRCGARLAQREDQNKRLGLRHSSDNPNWDWCVLSGLALRFRGNGEAVDPDNEETSGYDYAAREKDNGPEGSECEPRRGRSGSSRNLPAPYGAESAAA